MENLLDCAFVAWVWENALELLLLAGICLLLYRQWRVRYLNTHYENYRSQGCDKKYKYQYYSLERFTGPTLFKKRWSVEVNNYYFEDKVIGKPVKLFFWNYYDSVYCLLDFEYADTRKVAEKYYKGHQEMVTMFEDVLKKVFHDQREKSKHKPTCAEYAEDIKAYLEEHYGDVFKDGVVNVVSVKRLK